MLTVCACVSQGVTFLFFNGERYWYVGAVARGRHRRAVQDLLQDANHGAIGGVRVRLAGGDVPVLQQREVLVNGRRRGGVSRSACRHLTKCSPLDCHLRPSYGDEDIINEILNQEPCVIRQGGVYCIHE